MLERQRYELLRTELKNCRLKSGLFQRDLAKKLNKPQSYVSKVESGERNLDFVELITYCTALNLDPTSFLKKIIQKF